MLHRQTDIGEIGLALDGAQGDARVVEEQEVRRRSQGIRSIAESSEPVFHIIVRRISLLRQIVLRHLKQAARAVVERRERVGIDLARLVGDDARRCAVQRLQRHRRREQRTRFVIRIEVRHEAVERVGMREHVRVADDGGNGETQGHGEAARVRLESAQHVLAVGLPRRRSVHLARQIAQHPLLAQLVDGQAVQHEHVRTRSGQQIGVECAQRVVGRRARAVRDAHLHLDGHVGMPVAEGGDGLSHEGVVFQRIDDELLFNVGTFALDVPVERVQRSPVAVPVQDVQIAIGVYEQPLRMVAPAFEVRADAVQQTFDAVARAAKHRTARAEEQAVLRARKQRRASSPCRIPRRKRLFEPLLQRGFERLRLARRSVERREPRFHESAAARRGGHVDGSFASRRIGDVGIARKRNGAQLVAASGIHTGNARVSDREHRPVFRPPQPERLRRHGKRQRGKRVAVNEVERLVLARCRSISAHELPLRGQASTSVRQLHIERLAQIVGVERLRQHPVVAEGEHAHPPALAIPRRHEQPPRIRHPHIEHLVRLVGKVDLLLAKRRRSILHGNIVARRRATRHAAGQGKGKDDGKRCRLDVHGRLLLQAGAGACSGARCPECSSPLARPRRNARLVVG